MKTTLQCILAAGLASVVVFAASAQDPTGATVAADAENVAEAPRQDAMDSEAKDPIEARFCLRETGSRIVAMQNAKPDPAGKRCVNAPGRVYTNDDIRRTGAIDLAEALRMLDPSIP